MIPKSVAVTGATGFVGRHLVDRLLAEGASVRALARRQDVTAPAGVQVVRGDMCDRGAISRLITGVDVVVHLAYREAGTGAESERMAAALAEGALAADVERIVHVSTAVVVGSPRARVITEATPPAPKTSYQRRKLMIEEVLTARIGDRAHLSILRPTAIFGAGGQNLVKLVDDLRHDPLLVRAARRAMLGRRRLNLVYIDNVVEAIWFAATAESGRMRGCFIASDDDVDENNFGYVSDFVAERLSIRVPPTPDLTSLAAPLLAQRRRGATDAHAVFSPARLMGAGFRRPVPFTEALERFVAWYRSERLEVAA